MIKLLALVLLAQNLLAMGYRNDYGQGGGFGLLVLFLLLVALAAVVMGVLYVGVLIYDFSVQEAPRGGVIFIMYPLIAINAVVVPVNIYNSLKSSPAASLIGKKTGLESNHHLKDYGVSQDSGIEFYTEQKKKSIVITPDVIKADFKAHKK